MSSLLVALLWSVPYSHRRVPSTSLPTPIYSVGLHGTVSLQCHTPRCEWPPDRRRRWFTLPSPPVCPLDAATAGEYAGQTGSLSPVGGLGGLSPPEAQSGPETHSSVTLT